MKHQKQEIRVFHFALLSLLLLASCSNSRKSVKELSKIEQNTKKCISLIKEGREYWQKDSLGKNGYRILLSAEIFNSCNFENLKFEEIRSDLGKPNEVRNYEFGEGDFIYIVGNSSFLIIKVKDSIIIKFRVLTADG